MRFSRSSSFAPFCSGRAGKGKGGERGDLPIPPLLLSRARELCRAKEAIGLPDSPKKRGEGKRKEEGEE